MSEQWRSGAIGSSFEKSAKVPRDTFQHVPGGRAIGVFCRTPGRTHEFRTTAVLQRLQGDTLYRATGVLSAGSGYLFHQRVLTGTTLTAIQEESGASV